MGLLDLLLFSNSKKTKNILHGFDLAKYLYLGYSPIQIIHKQEVWARGTVHFFYNPSCDQLDYKLIGSKTEFKNHPFLNNCDLWKAREFNLYALIFNPSEYLKKVALEVHNYSWDERRQIFLKNDYPQKPKIPELGVDSNSSNVVSFTNNVEKKKL